ncbi:hypothetical protein [[Bacillus] enclensis]|uniref:hypothetical protein n=1 Tax=[Bacillus] enclensis TaxID=1402860 RepID=UPI0018DC08AB|nr:hypothetical protein [[Bacillus] enclensis]MBH9967971.1 hypothetical protein [[Bacillus] enclensis]
MKTEVYILGLFSFNGEEEKNVVFSNNELDTINSRIENVLGVKRLNLESKWVTYHLDHNEVIASLEGVSSHLTRAEMGYYHHRVIFRFTFEGNDFNSELRDIRQGLKEFSNELISSVIIKPNQDLLFERCDTYQLFIVHEGRKLFSKEADPIYSNDTTTMAFNITEPSKISPIGKKYNIRISIPSTIIYSQSGVSDDFLKAMINSIYQYCLYEKKELNRKKEISDIDETQLVHLWHHIIDTMGGRTLDKNIAKVSQTNFILAFGALLIAIVAFDVDKFKYNWSFLGDFFKIVSTIFI